MTILAISVTDALDQHPVVTILAALALTAALSIAAAWVVTWLSDA